jgi:hypothetical protein
MKIEIEVDDEYLKEHSKLSHTDSVLATNFILDWVEVGIRPCYDDGKEVYWIHVWLEPDKDMQPHKMRITEDKLNELQHTG